MCLAKSIIKLIKKCKNTNHIKHNLENQASASRKIEENGI